MAKFTVQGTETYFGLQVENHELFFCQYHTKEDKLAKDWNSVLAVLDSEGRLATYTQIDGITCE